MAKIARGERNNNPGNIRHGAKWQGLASTQTDKDFCQFISPEYGIRAIGIESNKPIDTQIKNVCISLSIAIINIELGYQPYAKKVFKDAWLLL